MRYRFFQILFTTTAFIFIQDISIKAQESIKLSLASCRDMALTQSESLKQAEHKYEQSRLDRKIANTAFLPKFDASATGTYVFPDIDMMGMDLRIRGMYMAGITLTQPLYAGGKILTGKKLSKLGESIAAEQKRMTMMDVLVEADNAYWTLIAVRQKVKMLDSYKEQMDSLYTQVKTAVDAGLATENELLRIEASRSDILYQMQKARNGEDLCRMSLCRITGVDAQTKLELTDTTICVKEPGLLAADINGRPELNLLKHQMDATQKQIQMSRADMLPTVGLVAGYAYYGNIKLNSMVDAGNGTMVPYSQEFRDGIGAVMLSVKIPIFQWGANLKKVKKAKLDFKNAELEFNKNSRLMNLEAQSALKNVYDGYQLIKTAETGLKQAEENLRVTNNKYNVSMALLTDLLDAQSQWKQAKSNLIEAQTQYKIYETEYLRATGRLNQELSPDL
ncbi:TolC family protein [Bacteroides caecigallinarum]|uniref:TolC family protein n=1 Tax=Bacteroides caecigallinarum TaxID=1411144 RepID=UPI00195C544A|nr:TolC family protein [Bacteroides caecigallinarum]MBM6881870.1 TolC family protein [Bacteroides caecigallinarum]